MEDSAIIVPLSFLIQTKIYLLINSSLFLSSSSLEELISLPLFSSFHLQSYEKSSKLLLKTSTSPWWKDTSSQSVSGYGGKSLLFLLSSRSLETPFSLSLSNPSTNRSFLFSSIHLSLLVSSPSSLFHSPPSLVELPSSFPLFHLFAYGSTFLSFHSLPFVVFSLLIKIISSSLLWLPLELFSLHQTIIQLSQIPSTFVGCLWNSFPSIKATIFQLKFLHLIFLYFRSSTFPLFLLLSFLILFQLFSSISSSLLTLQLSLFLHPAHFEDSLPLFSLITSLPAPIPSSLFLHPPLLAHESLPSFLFSPSLHMELSSSYLPLFSLLTHSLPALPLFSLHLDSLLHLNYLLLASNSFLHPPLPSSLPLELLPLHGTLFLCHPPLSSDSLLTFLLFPPWNSLPSSLPLPSFHSSSLASESFLSFPSITSLFGSTFLSFLHPLSSESIPSLPPSPLASDYLPLFSLIHLLLNLPSFLPPSTSRF
ncbi:unnamed protein product [Acanthosepion pharaonis]|uniref:Uncharacterized protein n=1 Tax=Acanthosepion pharaonis TaxID=158019 RepID=A0A812DEN0_ACAPH|nr:unnamed protein product [Sepia pharaonis]